MYKKALLEMFDMFLADIFPDRCCFCATVIDYKTYVCPDCRKTVKRISGNRCIFCGMSKDICECNNKKHFYNGITAPYIYEDKVRKGIIEWKYGQNARSLPFFAKQTARAVTETFDKIKFDAITFIPQTKAEENEKGKNQSETLAKEISKHLKIAVVPMLKKITETERQHDLPLYKRSGNVFGVFSCTNQNAVKGKTILLIDDIKTSGNTLNECAKMLQLNDAAEVYCAVIAIAKKPTANQKNQKERTPITHR